MKRIMQISVTVLLVTVGFNSFAQNKETTMYINSLLEHEAKLSFDEADTLFLMGFKRPEKRKGEFVVRMYKTDKGFKVESVDTRKMFERVFPATDCFMLASPRYGFPEMFFMKMKNESWVLARIAKGKGRLYYQKFMRFEKDVSTPEMFENSVMWSQDDGTIIIEERGSRDNANKQFALRVSPMLPWTYDANFP
jgi:hypothetical protein